jgi:glucosamine--fructose-6-phosphate aminotransferase (isomerizing)
MSAGIVDGSLWNDYGIAPFERVHIVACGSSYNAGMVIANMFRRLGGVPVRCTVASEIAEEVAEANTLCLAISQSGEIADVLRAVDAPAVYAAPLLAMTDNRHSALARRASAVMECGSGAEIGVTATKTFVCQVVSGAALVISALVATGGLSCRGAGQLVDDLRRLPDQLLEAIAKAKCVMPLLGEEFAIADGLVFAARGSGLPYAAEGALKVNELTYQWAQHFPAGEIKHGPMALIDRETPVVVVESGESRLTLNIDEIRARGGRIINIGGRCGALPLADSAHVPWGPLSAAPALQILARSIALARHNDVDKPRHLAKAVTVD